MEPPERPERMEADMSDPRFSDDPRFTSPEQRMREEPRMDPTLDPIERDRMGSGAVWGWVAGIAVLALIAFVLIGGWGGGGTTNTANNRPAPTATGSAPSTTPAPSGPATTGSAPSR
jgi:hypothetical protein